MGAGNGGPLAQIVGAIEPLLRPTTTTLSHVQEHLRLKQRGSGPRSGPEMEMKCPRVEIPTSNCLFQTIVDMADPYPGTAAQQRHFRLLASVVSSARTAMFTCGETRTLQGKSRSAEDVDLAMPGVLFKEALGSTAGGHRHNCRSQHDDSVSITFDPKANTVFDENLSICLLRTLNLKLSHLQSSSQ